VVIALTQHSASNGITSSKFRSTALHIQQINLYC